jgi:hypothetical protein
MRPAEEFLTLVHEIAHEMLHHGERRTLTTKEVRETEAVALVVCQSVGLDIGTASADYIQLWHGDAKLLQESLEVVQCTAAIIFGGFCPRRGLVVELSRNLSSNGDLQLRLQLPTFLGADFQCRVRANRLRRVLSRPQSCLSHFTFLTPFSRPFAALKTKLLTSEFALYSHTIIASGWLTANI